MIGIRKTVARHPGVKWACGAVEFIVIDALLILGITPAWAAVFPITEKITVDFGNLPNWIIALVAAGGFWKAGKAEKKATEAAATSAASAKHLAEVGLKIDGMLADRDKGNVAKGEARATAAAEAKAETLAEGRAEGIELGREMPPHPLAPHAIETTTEPLAAVAENLEKDK